MSVCASFVLVNLMPLTKARYTLPLLPLLVVLIAMVVNKIELPKKVSEILFRTFTLLFSLCIVTVAVTISVFLLLHRFQTSQSHGLLSVFLSIFDSKMLSVMFISFFVAIIALFLHIRLIRKRGNNSYRIFLSALLLVCVVSNLSFSLFQPLTLKRAPSNFARQIEAFFPVGTSICGIDFVGEEAFMVHLKRRSHVFKKISDIDGNLYKAFIINETQREELADYARRNSFCEVREKAVNYEKHKYILVELE
jgi:NO-binding membrane sensor protein with MHYT domain